MGRPASATPPGGIESLALRELWRAGGLDEDVIFGEIEQIVAGPEGNLYVLDSQLCQVMVFGPEGEFLRTLSREGEGPGEDLGSGVWSSFAIDALYDVLIDLDHECREALNREWESLLDYHESMSSGPRDFDASVRQMQSENPLTHNPIIDRARRDYLNIFVKTDV